AALSELAVDLEVVLAQDEPDGRGGKGHADRNDEDGPVGCVVQTARAQVAHDDGREQDDAQHEPAIEPPLHQKALQRLVIQVAPSFIPHCVKPGFAVRTNPVYHLADRFSLGGLPMTSPSLDEPIRVEVIAYVPTRFNH